jgi:hypothetical protein
MMDDDAIVAHVLTLLQQEAGGAQISVGGGLA